MVDGWTGVTKLRKDDGPEVGVEAAGVEVRCSAAEEEMEGMRLGGWNERSRCCYGGRL